MEVAKSRTRIARTAALRFLDPISELELLFTQKSPMRLQSNLADLNMGNCTGDL
jgi:hypothetical protein